MTSHQDAAQTGFERTRTLLSAAWVFAMFNYLYADVMGLMDAPLLRQFLDGHVAGLTLSPGFLFAAAVLMEIPIAMTFLSKVLPHRANRIANLAAGSLKSIVVALTLLLGRPTPYYLFFALIEVACTGLIVITAWRWAAPSRSSARPLATSSPL
jgi:hypothetical protein